MDMMEKIELDNQMTVLQVEEEAQHTNDEAEDLSNSLREIVQDEAVKPKLHCLMMDPSFSMVTVQSEDSSIIWETASSRCSTPWSSEMNSTTLEPCYSLVPKCPGTPSSETAGKIVFIMDEEHIIRRKKKKRNKFEKKMIKQLSNDELPEPERPAMVEISLPNMGKENTREMTEEEGQKEEGNQHLFRLVSEGSEILNIIVPPKMSTVDEEESKGLIDNLSYLEDTPVIKAEEFTDELETSEKTKNLEHLQSRIPQVPEPISLLPPTKPPRRGATSEDYFEKFTLLDHQTPAVTATVETIQEPDTTSDQVVQSKETNAVDAKPSIDIQAESGSDSRLEIAAEHIDDVFYGGGRDPDHQSISGHTTNKKGELLKSPLKASGSALFGSQESILTPIFLPEGPPKIIDLVLLEEPKAMAFMYSDLYAEALGSRKKQDDTESVTSEKSFHSQESDLEDRGYLEKFVLKDETPATKENPVPENHKEERAKMLSQDAFGLIQHEKDQTGPLEDEDEITDFFRNSASSSPCEPIHLEDVEPEETKKILSKARHVVFQDEVAKDDKRTKEADNNIVHTLDEDIEIAEAFLPVDICMESEALGASWETLVEKSTASANPSKSEKTRVARIKHNVKTPLSVQPPQTVKPLIPQHKPFLDLTPLLPAEMMEETSGHEAIKKEDGVMGTNNLSSSTVDATTDEMLNYELISKQEADECVSPSEAECPNNGFTMVEHPSQMDSMYVAVEAEYEIVDGPVS